MTQSGSQVLLNERFDKELVGAGWSAAARCLITRAVYVCVCLHSVFVRSDVNQVISVAQNKKVNCNILAFLLL